MSLLLVFLILLGIVLLALLGLSVGIAFLLHWLLPAVGLEMALLVGVIGVRQAMFIVGRLLGTLPPPGGEPEDVSEAPIIVLDRELGLPRRRRKRI